MPTWIVRSLIAVVGLILGIALIRVVSNLAARGYRALVGGVDRMVSTVAGGGGAAVEQVVSLALTLIVVILVVKFLVKGRL